MGRTACALSVTYGDSSPKGRASGETAHFAVQLVTFPLCQGLSLWERWICEAKTERARTLAGEFPRQELNSLSQSLRLCQLPLGGSLWRERKLCTLAGNCAAMPKAPSPRTTSPGRGKMSPQVTKGGIWHRAAMTRGVFSHTLFLHKLPAFRPNH